MATFAGCHSHHPTGHHTPVPIVAGIEVHEHDILGSRLEIEVHLYDADSGKLLGCSGDANGLADVNEPHVRYRTHAEFVRPYHEHEILRLRHIEGRALFVRVYEDDLSRCPSPAGSADDFIGQSPVFSGDEFRDGIVMAFDDVAYLRLSMGY
jgi:hypothetical protein